MNEIRKVSHVRDYVLYVEFDDGTCGDIDLSQYPERGPIFAPLADLEFFKKVGIEGGTLSWPNGADIAPESIYEKVVSTAQAVHEEKSDRYNENDQLA